MFKKLWKPIELFTGFPTMYSVEFYKTPILSYHNHNIVSRFSHVSFSRKNNIVKMDLVLQFLTKKSLLGLIRKRKRNSTIASKLFLNFDFVTEILNFQVNQQRVEKKFFEYFSNCETEEIKFKKSLDAIVEKTFLYRLTRFLTRYVENCGTRSIFGNTYFFGSKNFFSFFGKNWLDEILIVFKLGWGLFVKKISAQSVHRKPKSISEWRGLKWICQIKHTNLKVKTWYYWFDPKEYYVEFD